MAAAKKLAKYFERRPDTKTLADLKRKAAAKKKHDLEMVFGKTGSGKSQASMKEMWKKIIGKKSETTGDAPMNDLGGGSKTAFFNQNLQHPNPFTPASPSPAQPISPFTSSTYGYWESSGYGTAPHLKKEKTPEEIEIEKKRAIEEDEGRRGKLVAVVEWCIKGDVKIGVLFLKNNGAYELLDYNGLIIASGSPGAMKDPLPRKLKITHTIYNAAAEERKRKEPKPEDDLYDIEILD